MDFTIAQTIISQMGGLNILRMFVNARNFVATDNSVEFQFSGSRKYNFCKIIYNYGMDLYTMHFIKKVKEEVKREDIVEEQYCDTIAGTFQKVTNLFLSF